MEYCGQRPETVPYCTAVFRGCKLQTRGAIEGIKNAFIKNYTRDDRLLTRAMR